MSIRVRLKEADLKTLVEGGVVLVHTSAFERSDPEKTPVEVSHKPVDVEIILADIGTDRIRSILDGAKR